MFSLQSVYHAADVILGSADDDISVSDIDRVYDNTDALHEAVRLFQKYVFFNQRVESKMKGIREILLKNSWKVLGVVFRGTDYQNRPVVGEHRQPSLAETMDQAQKFMVEWNCDHIFLATEDAGAVEAFRKRFLDAVVFIAKERYPSDTKSTQNYHFERDQDAYFKGEEYLMELYILSKCDCLLASRVGAAWMSLVINGEKYEHQYIYDLGLYTKEDYLIN